MLPEASKTIEENQNNKQNLKNTFLESIKVSPEELAKNMEKQPKDIRNHLK